MEFPFESDIPELTTSINQGLSKLYNIWEECGYNTEDLNKRRKQLVKHVEDLFCAMSEEEGKCKEEMLENKTKLLDEYDSLCRELHLTNSLTCDNIPLYEVGDYVLKEVNKLRNKKAAHMEKYLNIIEKEREICHRLGKMTEIKCTNAIPTEDDYRLFEQRLNELHQEQECRRTNFRNVKTIIISLMKELEISPKDAFETEVVCGTEENFILSPNNMKKLKELESQLRNKINERNDHFSALQKKVSMLWIRTSESPTYRGNFIATHNDVSGQTITALENEIKRCEEIKKQNLPAYLMKVRSEINDLWDKCHIGDTQRRDFVPFYAEGCTDELLEAHEKEVNRLYEFYQENKHIYDIAEHYKNLCNRLEHIEEKSHDKNRFKNRGGELLKEEKERNAIQREIPRVERELKRYITLYTEKQGQPFFYDGEDLSQLINSRTDQQQQRSVQKHKSTAEKLMSKRKMEQEQNHPCKVLRSGTVKKNAPPALLGKAHAPVARKLNLPVAKLGCTYVKDFALLDNDYKNFKENLESRNLDEPWHSSAYRRPVLHVVNQATNNDMRAPVKPPRKHLHAERRRSSGGDEEISKRRNRGRRSSLPNDGML